MEFKKDILTTREGDTITFNRVQGTWVKKCMYDGYEKISRRSVAKLIHIDYGHSDLNVLLSNRACKNLFGVSLEEWNQQIQ